MAPGGSERPTNRRNGRSILAGGRPERVAQVRTHRTAPLDQPAADPSSLPVSRLRDPMNQRTSCASTGEFFNTICHEETWGLDFAPAVCAQATSGIYALSIWPTQLPENRAFPKLS